MLLVKITHFFVVNFVKVITIYVNLRLGLNYFPAQNLDNIFNVIGITRHQRLKNNKFNQRDKAYYFTFSSNNLSSC